MDGVAPTFRHGKGILKALLTQLADARPETLATLDDVVARARGAIRDAVADAAAARAGVAG